MKEVDKQVNKMLDIRGHRTSNSHWGTTFVLVRKIDWSMCFCINYRRVKEVTVKDAYPFLNIDEALFICKDRLDLNNGYLQVEMEEDNKCKTTFVTRNLLQFKVMPFSLSCAPEH